MTLAFVYRTVLLHARKCQKHSEEGGTDLSNLATATVQSSDRHEQTRGKPSLRRHIKTIEYM